MKSGVKKIIIVLVVIFASALFLWAGVAFFAKDNSIPKTADDQQDGQQPGGLDEDSEITEEAKAKSFAESFVVTYYSYTWGNFSNIESQYYYMADRMKKEEEIKVEKIKEGTKNQPQKYFTARAELLDSNFVSYEETEAILEIDLIINNYAGAMAQKETLVWVDEKGDYYEGDLNDILVSAVEKKVRVEIIKISEDWKINKIEEIKE